MNSYELSRKWFDWCFENPEKINPTHTAIYMFAIEHCNRLGWKDKFGFPSQMTMDALGIKKHSTYIKYFNELVEMGFFKLVQKSKNQYSANIISLKSAIPKNGKALDKAFVKHVAKQSESIGQSIRSIDKQLNNITIKQINKQTDVFCDFINKNHENIFGEKERGIYPHFEEVLSGYEFLKKHAQLRIETFEMQNMKTFDNYDVFKTNFNSKVLEEEIAFNVSALFARLERLNANWNKSKNHKRDSQGRLVANFSNPII